MAKKSIEEISLLAKERGFVLLGDKRLVNNKLLLQCTVCHNKIERTYNNLRNAKNACPTCHIKNRPKKDCICIICNSVYKVSFSSTRSHGLCSKECVRAHATHKRQKVRKLIKCIQCGERRFILDISMKGVSASSRPCKKCRSKNVSSKTKGRIPWNKGLPISEETKEKLRAFNLGRPAYNKGIPISEERRKKIACSVRGISLEEFDGFADRDDRVEFKSSNLNYRCFERDDYTCQKCNIRGIRLNAHHMNSWKHFPDERFSLNNLITLCQQCHRQFHNKFGYGHKEPNTKEQIENFLNKEKL